MMIAEAFGNFFKENSFPGSWWRHNKCSLSSAYGCYQIHYAQFNIVGVLSKLNVFVRHNRGLKLKPVDLLPLFGRLAINSVDGVNMPVTALILFKFAFHQQPGAQIMKFNLIRFEEWIFWIVAKFKINFSDESIPFLVDFKYTVIAAANFYLLILMKLRNKNIFFVPFLFPRMFIATPFIFA